jgi:hypothetical protein
MRIRPPSAQRRAIAQLRRSMPLALELRQNPTARPAHCPRPGVEHPDRWNPRLVRARRQAMPHSRETINSLRLM